MIRNRVNCNILSKMGDTATAPTLRTKIKRGANRAVYVHEEVLNILDEGLVAHVGIVHDGSPVVIPMGYARMGDKLLLHGHISSRLMKVNVSGLCRCKMFVTDVSTECCSFDIA